MNIPISKPYFDECEDENILKPLHSGWVVQGKFVQEFQTLFASHVEVKYAHATTSCTTALHLALVALDIGADDEVIIPSFTYIATANVVEHVGAKPLFCDIELDSFNMDVSKIETLITKKTKVIIAVNLFGLCANLEEIIKLAKKYNLKVIEDSACGFDAWLGQKHSGTFGDIGCFSFHPRKSLCTGEGGMLITNDDELNSKIAQLKDHGASKSDMLRHKEGGSLLPEFNFAGFNYRMTDMQGALGVCQMKKASEIMCKKRILAKRYDEALKELNFLQVPTFSVEYVHGYQSYVCLFTDSQDVRNLTKEKIDIINIKRNIFMKKLESCGIATRQGTHAVHTLGFYKEKYDLKSEDFLMSYAADRLTIALPLYPQMSDEEFDYVVSQLKSCSNSE
ncbi:DegT/DnrJ/EryC1/StrS aminotransferase [Sulfurimonas denitrificans DSM 1251]|uniref:DegT/DnrJ/EryC1/StrS aminotransferase n=1 Tax=Sulfurimonas denitrificans (strain ATCC 33889 / DSM 1251) TaxID=326298 RepID=Q30U60_SULDN|nr:DegT/DnrJ/EryC1/StrS family aminotransferase [Sulfurimonas denitrificans]ABB43471.1 DegT/DnrJ/EryC1/StrS aminotransferase [Sulfurimonas denitrificans DSM 1251]